MTQAERTVALYASDMPASRRRWSHDQVRAWLAQGVERLGAEELGRRALFLAGHGRLSRSRVVPVQVQARHEQRFPVAGRLDRAGRVATDSVCWAGITDAAMRRSGTAEVDGGCPCKGTRVVPLSADGSFGLSCPVHGLSQHFGGVR
jgi:hypothetical protein